MAWRVSRGWAGGILLAVVAALGCLDSPPASVDPGQSDAMGNSGDCPQVCDSCGDDGTCIIDCDEDNCEEPIFCPPGRPCQVTCTGYAACENTPIDCLDATSCLIRCTGHDACQDGIRCGGSSCSVTCDGAQACSDSGVECLADSCEIGCYGESACESGVCCDGVECGTMCTSVDGGCCRCVGCA